MLGMLDFNIGHLSYRNETGVYSEYFRKQRYLWIQDPKLDPPTFPVTRNNKQV